MRLDEVRGVYDSRAAIPFDGSTNRAEIEAALALVVTIAPRRDTRILDAGCGTGWFLRALSEANYTRLYGLDVSAASLRRASAVCNADAAVFILGEVAALDTATFELITALNSCLGCFGALDDQRFVQGLFNALLPSGRLLLSYIGPASAQRRLGNYETAYDRSGAVVSSSVRLAPDGGELIIEQSLWGKALPDERIAILSRDAIDAMLEAAGFATWEPLNAAETSEALRYVELVLASKPL